MINTQYLAKGIRFVFLLIFLSNFSISNAQSYEFSGSAGMAKKLAINSLRLGDIYSAIDYYEYFLVKKPDNDDIKYKLAELYYKIKSYDKALFYFQTVYDIAPKDYVLAHYYIADILRTQGDYTGAKEALTYFNKKEVRNIAEKKKYKKLATNAIAGCDLALKLLESEKEVNLYRLDSTINSSYTEQSPLIVNDKLYFSGLNVHALKYYKAEELDLAPKRKFFTAERNPYGKWVRDEITFFDDTLSNYANGTFSPDKKKFYFNKCKKNSSNKMICKIYVAKYENEVFSEITELPDPINISGSSSTMPAISYDAKKKQDIIYFVSDREDKSKGGYDIWYINYNEAKNKYGKLKNLGNNINTPGDEITPFIDPVTKTLYFSSNGLSGMGGFDIFESTGNSSKWTKANNIGSPFNTGYDDIYYIVNDNQRKGYFTSNRSGGSSLKGENCCDDIFKYNYDEEPTYLEEGEEVELEANLDTISENNTDSLIASSKNISVNDVEEKKLDSLVTNLEEKAPELITPEKPTETTINGSLYMDNNKDVNILIHKLLEGFDTEATLLSTSISLYKIDPATNNSILISTIKPSKDKKFSFPVDKGQKYQLKITHKDIINKDKDITTVDLIADENNKFNLEPISIEALPGDKIKFDILYDYDSANLTESSEFKLEALYEILVKIPKAGLLVLSHSDSKGADYYNLKLSQQRAESVVNYLVTKGIKKTRLKATGYGETKPIAPNTNPDGSDNPEGRKKNRRTEIEFKKL
jgi:outer membrane protein OmpA-like peptidoglycan-associated protein